VKIVSVMTTNSRGGAEVAAANLLDALASRNHEIVMLTNMPDIVHSETVATRTIDIGPKLSLATYRSLTLKAPLLIRRLRSALDRESPYDVLLLHFKKEQLLASALPSRLRRTLVWAEWGPVPLELRGLPIRLYRFAASKTALVLAVSEGTRRSLLEAGIADNRIALVPSAQPVDAICFSKEGRRGVRSELAIPEGAFVVGCLSRLHPKKRNDVLVEAVKRLDESVHLVFAGEGKAEHELRRLAEPLGERAHFLPNPSASAVPDVLSAFDVSVFCPSPTEAAQGAVIVSMLTERPIVSSAREGAEETITAGIGAIASPDHDPAALAAILRDYANDPKRVLREGRLGRLRAIETNSASVVAERVEELLEQAIATSGDRALNRKMR